MSPVIYRHFSVNPVCHSPEHTFRYIHHSVIIRVCLIKFHKRKLGIMPYGNTLVPENAPYFINPFKTSDNKPFKRKLQSYTAVHINIKGVMVSYKRPCRRPAWYCLKHRRFNLKKSFFIKEIPYLPYDCGSFEENFLNFGIYNKIHISLTVPKLLIFKAMELFRKYLKTFAQKHNFGCMYGNFAHFSCKNRAFNAYNISNIIFFKIGIAFLAYIVAAYIKLHPAVSVLNICKTCLSHNPFSHKTAGNGNFLAFIFAVAFNNFICMGIDRIFNFLERVFAFALQFFKLFTPDFKKLAEFFLAYLAFIIHIFCIICHSFVLLTYCCCLSQAL